MSKKNAMRKLKEFQRWQRIANSLNLTYNERYQFDIDYHPTRRKHLEISRECALEELDAIKKLILQLQSDNWQKYFYIFLNIGTSQDITGVSVYVNPLNSLVLDSNKQHLFHNKYDKEYYYYDRRNVISSPTPYLLLESGCHILPPL